MKKISAIFLLLTLIPGYAFACSGNGFTVVYVNGIFTTVGQADQDVQVLKELIGQSFLNQSITVLTGYNPMHLDGLGDMVESVTQALNIPISDYDLETLLAQVAARVLTGKLLLIGHSQGTFYTNEIYDYLVKQGVPPKSVAVYNIATPAGTVEGDGSYITSSNDKVINYVRGVDAQWGAQKALPANITVEEEPGYADDAWGGHVPEVYFNGAGKRITSDIKKVLGQLSADDRPGDCIAGPTTGLTYDLEKLAFGVADPAAMGVSQAAAGLSTAVGSAFHTVNDTVNEVASDIIFSVIPRPTAQNAAGVFAVEKALYGSSLSVADYEALLNGQDIPEVQPIPLRTTGPDQKELPAPAKPPTGQAASTEAATSETKALPAQTATSDEKVIAGATTTRIAPVLSLVPITPGLGGGGPSPAQTQAPQETVIDPGPSASSSATSSPDDVPVVSATSTATSSIATATSTGAVATTTAVSDASGTIPAVSSVIDTFDDGFSGWSSYAVGWRTASWSTSTSDCYSGNCLSETDFNRLYQNIKTGTPLSSGSFVLYFRNHGFNGQYSIGVCTDLTPTACENPETLGGVNALDFHLIGNYEDDAWHYFYFAFQDGPVSKEYCVLVDDTELSDCVWIISPAPNGTTYSGILFNTENGLLPGVAFYWDELGTTTRPSRQGVQ